MFVDRADFFFSSKTIDRFVSRAYYYNVMYAGTDVYVAVFFFFDSCKYTYLAIRPT